MNTLEALHQRPERHLAFDFLNSTSSSSVRIRMYDRKFKFLVNLECAFEGKSNVKDLALRICLRCRQRQTSDDVGNSCWETKDLDWWYKEVRGDGKAAARWVFWFFQRVFPLDCALWFLQAKLSHLSQSQSSSTVWNCTVSVLIMLEQIGPKFRLHVS